MKRTISLLLALLISFTCCACGTQNNSDTSSLKAEASTSEPSISEPEESKPESTASSSALPESEPSISAASESGHSSKTPSQSEEKPQSTPSQAPVSRNDETPRETEKPTSAPSKPAEEKNPPVETPKPTPTEPPAPSTPESKPEPTEQPKSDYDYPFNIDTIRSYCIGIAQGYGLTLDTSLNKGNSSYGDPVAATSNTQGDFLKRQLREAIMYYADAEYRDAMGLTPLDLTVFNIYCESTGNGGYVIYFLR